MKKFNTQYQRITKRITSSIFFSVIGSWRKRSLGLITLLLGYYLGSNIISYLINTTNTKLIILILLLFFVELIVRIRTKFRISNTFNYHIYASDNIRIGMTYAIVLEAFKLGS